MRNFTLEDAQRLITKMRINYGKKFIDQWTGVHESELRQAMVEAYQGLSMEDFARGYTRMLQEQWPPTIPEFRAWCLPQSDTWLDAHEAWAIAKNSVEFATGRELTVVWTEQAAKAFEKCADLVVTGDKYQLSEAKKIFISIYERLVTEAKDKGLKPVYNVSLGIDPDQRIDAIKQAEIAGFLTSEESQIQLEYKQSKEAQKRESEQWKTTAQKALANLKEQMKIKPVNKMTEETQLSELKPDSDYWPDPFDDKEKYIEMYDKDGKAVPLVIKRGAA